MRPLLYTNSIDSSCGSSDFHLGVRRSYWLGCWRTCTTWTYCTWHARTFVHSRSMRPRLYTTSIDSCVWSSEVHPGFRRGYCVKLGCWLTCTTWTYVQQAADECLTLRSTSWSRFSGQASTLWCKWCLGRLTATRKVRDRAADVRLALRSTSWNCLSQAVVSVLLPYVLCDTVLQREAELMSVRCAFSTPIGIQYVFSEWKEDARQT